MAISSLLQFTSWMSTTISNGPNMWWYSSPVKEKMTTSLEMQFNQGRLIQRLRHRSQQRHGHVTANQFHDKWQEKTFYFMEQRKEFGKLLKRLIQIMKMHLIGTWVNFGNTSPCRSTLPRRLCNQLLVIKSPTIKTILLYFYLLSLFTQSPINNTTIQHNKSNSIRQ